MSKSSYTVRRMIGEIAGVILVLVLLWVFVGRPYVRARKWAMASTVLNECRQIESAKESYALENSKTPASKVGFADLTPYLKAGSRLVANGGNDSLGNPFFIGRVADWSYVNPRTTAAFGPDIAENFWGPYDSRSLVGAVDVNDLNTLKKLIAEGLDPKISGGDALVHAARFGRTEMAEILIAHGADVNVQGVSFQSTKLGVYWQNSIHGFESPLIDASAGGHADTVRLLLEHGADPEMDHGRALRCAKERGHTNVVEILKKAGAKE